MPPWILVKLQQPVLLVGGHIKICNLAGDTATASGIRVFFNGVSVATFEDGKDEVFEIYEIFR